MATVSTAIPPTQPQARPITPHCDPARKAAGITTAPMIVTFKAMPGKPRALVAGANRICSVSIAMAIASTGSSGTIPAHFSPSSTGTSTGATTASPA